MSREIPKYELCETVYDLTWDLAMLGVKLANGRLAEAIEALGYEDSRELFWDIVQWAKEFNHVYNPEDDYQWEYYRYFDREILPCFIKEDADA